MAGYRCFVIMPFGDKDKDPRTYKHFRNIMDSIKEALESVGIEAKRGDDFQHDRTISDTIEREIRTSQFCICDISDRYNANVFYELGMRIGSLIKNSLIH